uniref:Uncharacterized protein n=1 Tax=Gouania willdenowi TaxID=441366 RepID=A0A8C5E2W5_GOUWI
TTPCFAVVCQTPGLSWTGPCNRVWRFNLVTHTWQEMSPMQESRYLMSVTMLKGYIYAMGGCRDDDGTLLRTAERYQPNINQWTFIGSMNEGREDASCTTLNNKIYICGGWSNRSLNTAEYYNPDTNQWTLITPMGTPRCDLGVVAYMGHIFAVGGSDGFRDLTLSLSKYIRHFSPIKSNLLRLDVKATLLDGKFFFPPHPQIRRERVV